MAYTNFVNGTQPALSEPVLNQMQIGLMELVFPIGSTYITQTNTNPNTILKFGTWERLKGKVCLGIDEDDTSLNATGKMGGEKTHTLTADEIPSHSHEIDIAGTKITKANSNMNTGGTFWNMAIGKEGEYNLSLLPTGGGQAHNNMQPYEVVGYMWIRRS